MSDLSVEIELKSITKATAYFRDLETYLLRHIDQAEAVVGCVAWLTNLKILHALSTKQAVSIIVQKEEFLHPDLEPLMPNWKAILRRHYDAIPPIVNPGNLMAGWLEIRESEDAIGLGMPFYAVGMRCIGYIKSQEQTLPRMHHKFLAFLRQRDKADKKVEEGAWPYLPYAVWTRSYNITKNGNCSL